MTEKESLAESKVTRAFVGLIVILSVITFCRIFIFKGVEQMSDAANAECEAKELWIESNMAMKERDFKRALALANRILEEYPDTMTADEVKKEIEFLEEEAERWSDD
ncbi:hypothetical protein ACFL54_04260 [Planctomycetota bacterium]